MQCVLPLPAVANDGCRSHDAHYAAQCACTIGHKRMRVQRADTCCSCRCLHACVHSRSHAAREHCFTNCCFMLLELPCGQSEYCSRARNRPHGMGLISTLSKQDNFRTQHARQRDVYKEEDTRVVCSWV